MNIVYTVEKDGVEQSELGTFPSYENAEEAIYRMITDVIAGTGEQFHEAVKPFTVGKKEVKRGSRNP